jgi:Peptidase M50B-like
MPAIATDLARSVAEAAGRVGHAHLQSGVLGDLWRHAAGVWHHALAAQPLPPQWLVVGSSVLALAAVASARVWPITRTVVTIVHEAGHAIVALATGQRKVRVRLYRDTAGETVSASAAARPGIALTAAAGYPAPSLAGLGSAAMLATGHVTGLLLLGLVLLAGLAAAIRNPYGVVAVLATGATLAAICLYGSALIQSGFAYALTWFLLFGGVRPVVELQRQRRTGRTRRSDADHLARLTPLPGGAWVMIFAILALAALTISGIWLVR